MKEKQIQLIKILIVACNRSWQSAVSNNILFLSALDNISSIWRLLIIPVRYLDLPDHTTPYLILPHVILPYYSVPCLNISYLTIPYLLSHNTIPYHTLPFLTMPYLSIPFHAIPYYTITSHTIPYRHAFEKVAQKRCTVVVGSFGWDAHKTTVIQQHGHFQPPNLPYILIHRATKNGGLSEPQYPQMSRYTTDCHPRMH